MIKKKKTENAMFVLSSQDFSQDFVYEGMRVDITYLNSHSAKCPKTLSTFWSVCEIIIFNFIFMDFYVSFFGKKSGKVRIFFQKRVHELVLVTVLPSNCQLSSDKRRGHGL